MLVANFILFQLAWFACVMGAAKDMPWAGVSVTLIILCWHFYHAKQAKPEIVLMLTALFSGAIFDQSLLAMHLVEYHAHGWSNELVPVWILALWLAFASTLNVSLGWMHERYVVAVLFGAAGGPLAYLAAQKLGAVTVQGSTAYMALAIGWGVITPLLILTAKRFNGFQLKASS